MFCTKKDDTKIMEKLKDMFVKDNDDIVKISVCPDCDWFEDDYGRDNRVYRIDMTLKRHVPASFPEEKKFNDSVQYIGAYLERPEDDIHHVQFYSTAPLD